jgi:hypothetical protein
VITTEPDLFATLMQRIRDVLPQVERLRTRPAKVALNEPAQVSTRGKEIHYLETREVIGHELLFDLTDAPGIPARAVSEGTLLVTALLTAEQVWILAADDARGVVARRLSDHPRAADTLQVLTTGEFLDAEGEDWVRDAPDAA